MNPLDWPAEPFLGFYSIVAVIALMVIGWLRHRVGPGLHGYGTAGLNVFEMAYLAGGAARAAETILVALFEAGVACLGRKPNRIRIEVSSVVPVDLRVYVSLLPQEMTLRTFHSVVDERTEPLHAELAARGLIASEGASEDFQVVAALILAVPLVLGASKIVLGHERDRPVFALIFLVLLTAVLGFRMSSRRPNRTWAGTAELKRVRKEKARLARAPRDDELLLAFALMGSAVLAGRSYHALFAPPDGGDGGGDGGGGDGGGGGGCGGCSA